MYRNKITLHERETRMANSVIQLLGGLGVGLITVENEDKEKRTEEGMINWG